MSARNPGALGLACFAGRGLRRPGKLAFLSHNAMPKAPNLRSMQAPQHRLGDTQATAASSHSANRNHRA